MTYEGGITWLSPETLILLRKTKEKFCSYLVFNTLLYLLLKLTMANNLETSLSKIEKLDSGNYHTWKWDMEVLLTLKDMWEDMQDARPPPGEEREIWRKLQKHTLAIIHLSCSRETAAMIADATTGIEACTTLSDTYASANI